MVRLARARWLRKVRMPIKPLAQLCRIREQIVEDLPSGLTLQFEALEGGEVRLVIAGKMLGANREILFDAQGNAVRQGPSPQALRRASWLH